MNSLIIKTLFNPTLRKRSGGVINKNEKKAF